MKLAIKPPYTVAACVAGTADPDDLFVINAVDELMRALRIHELAVGMDTEHRNMLLKKHVDAAFEYYSDFDKADMVKILLVESLMREGGGDDEK